MTCVFLLSYAFLSKSLTNTSISNFEHIPNFIFFCPVTSRKLSYHEYPVISDGFCTQNFDVGSEILYIVHT